MNPCLPSTDPAFPRTRKTWRAGTLIYTSASLAALLFWLIWGDFAWQLKERSVMPVVQVLLKRFEASDLLSGFLLATIPAAITMIIGPIASYRSDRHRGKWGRRIPYLLAPTPVIAVTMMGLAFSPWLGRHLHQLLGGCSLSLNFCNLAIIGIFWSLFEIGTVIANSIFGALVNDVVPQEMLGRFFGIFRTISLLAGILFNKYIFGLSDTRYPQIFLGMGAIYAVGFTAMCLKVKEGNYPPPSRQDSRAHAFDSLITYFRETYTKPFYLLAGCVITLTGAGAGTGIIFTPVNLYSVYYAESVGMSRQSYGDHVACAYTISLCLAYFLGVLVDRFHPLRMGLIALVLYFAVSLWAAFYATNPANFGFAFVAHVVLSGMYFTTTASLAQRLFPRDRFAQFFSAFGILGSVVSMIMPLVFGAALDWNGRHYQSTFLWGAMLSFALMIPMSVLFFWFQRLGGTRGFSPPAV